MKKNRIVSVIIAVAVVMSMTFASGLGVFAGTVTNGTTAAGTTAAMLHILQGQLKIQAL